MGIGCRKFIVDDEGRLVRLKNTLFERLLRDPQHHTMPALAGQRVRMAEILVLLDERRPIRVVRRVYYGFVAQGSQWRPSSGLAQRIDDMALGKA